MENLLPGVLVSREKKAIILCPQPAGAVNSVNSRKLSEH